MCCGNCGECGTDIQETQMTCWNEIYWSREVTPTQQQFTHVAPASILMRQSHQEVYKANERSLVSLNCIWYQPVGPSLSKGACLPIRHCFVSGENGKQDVIPITNPSFLMERSTLTITLLSKMNTTKQKR